MPMRVALFCPDYLQINGQALVTRRVVEHLLPQIGAGRQYAYSTGFNVGALLGWCVAVARLWFDLVLQRISTIYIVCSRSNAGFLRDVPALLMAHMGNRVVVHSHGSDIVELLTSRMVSPFARWLYAPCILVIPSRHLLASLASVQLRELIVIENFSTADPSELPINGSRPQIPFTLLWNSNLMASKGIFETLTAAASLRQEGLVLNVEVIGAPVADDDMSAERVAAEFEVHKKCESISYHGCVSAETSRFLLRNSDVVALPSRYVSECQPLSVIEAMCAGKALIVSDSPALCSTIADYPAEVVPAGNVSAIRQALLKLHKEMLVDPSAFLTRRLAGSRAAQRRFSTDRFDEQMLRLLRGEASANEDSRNELR